MNANPVVTGSNRERRISAINGWAMLVFTLLLIAGTIAVFLYGAIHE